MTINNKLINEKNYLNLIHKILNHGVLRKEERTGVGAYSKFGVSIHFNLANSFPLFTHRQIFYKGVIGELIAFINGYTNIKDFNKLGCNYWNDFADSNGDLGPIYGYQWNNYNGQGVNQLENLIKEAKINPQSRRLYVTAWNPNQIQEMRLPPCFHGFQIFIHEKKLNMLVHMRSSDVMLGLPSDVLFHALLMLVISNEMRLFPEKLTFTLGDAHIYRNHFEYANKIKYFEPHNPAKVILNADSSIKNLKPEDFMIIDYNHNAPYKLPIND